MLRKDMEGNMSDFISEGKNLFVKQTSLKGLFKVERQTHFDERGFFREVFHLDELEEEAGEKINFIQMILQDIMWWEKLPEPTLTLKAR